MFSTIRQKLLAILFFFICIAVVSSIIIINYFEKNKDSLSAITVRIGSIDKLLLEDVNVTHEFFERETTNPLFFRTGKSEILDLHANLCQKIEHDLDELNRLQERKNFNLERNISETKANFSHYENRINTMVGLITARGYKDYGIEGKMRNYVHALENYDAEIGMINILTLRRHEKDFIIRQEDQYLTLHNQLINSLVSKLSADDESTFPKKGEVLTLLNNYSKYFNILVSFEKRIGLRSQKGLKEAVDKSAQRTHASLSGLILTAAQKEQEGLMRSKVLFAMMWVLFVMISIISVFTISKRATSSIAALNDNIDDFVNSDFTLRSTGPIKNTTIEVNDLAGNFDIMKERIINLTSALHKKEEEYDILKKIAASYPKPALAKLEGHSERNDKKITV